MNFTRLSFVFYFIFLSFNLEAKLISKSSFALECSDTHSVNHLLPLSFFEFQESNIAILNSGYTESLEKFAPTIFKSYKKDFLKLEQTQDSIPYPDYSEYDPISPLPSGCKVISMLKEDRNHPNGIVVNKQFWNQLSKDKQAFFLFDYYIQSYLKKDLESADYRRFSYYLFSGVFDKYTDRQKIDFFKFYGINEYNYSGISLNANAEIAYIENTDLIKDAFPYNKATFEGALLDSRKFISFSKNKTVIAIATTTPFTRKINGQDFQFFMPAELAPEKNEDPRYEPRMRFYEDGNVEVGVIKPVVHFFNLVTKINSKLGYIIVTFYPNNIPATFKLGECSIFSSRCDGFGNIGYNNNEYKVVFVKWYNNKKMERLNFAKREKVDVPGQGKIFLQELYFDENEIPTGGFPG